MAQFSSSPPKAPPIKYVAPLGTRWAKEKAAAGGSSAFDLPTDPKSIGPWTLGECIGKGASGRVKIAKHKRTGQLAAIKILPVAPLVNSRASLATQQAKTDKQRLGIDREITMMKLMNHPNIMRIYDVYEGDKELFLVLEYVEGGELFDYLVNRGRLPPAEALIYFKQIVYGLNYAHTFSIIHRDLKPENILIASLNPPIIKIADWGMAAFAPPSLQLETSCGSPHYASPEIVNGEKYEGNATDIWSCGVILFALLTGRLPFDDKNVRALLAKVKSGKYDMPSWIDPLAKDLLTQMLVVDVTKRITIPAILAHPWLKTTPTLTLPKTIPDAVVQEAIDPPLPPSPSTLARPIVSPSRIDPELFSSLRIIWGRHTDPNGESIKRDLCSPAGYGVHAKAFYFLLRKYRDEAYRSSREATDESQDGNDLLSTAKFNLVTNAKGGEPPPNYLHVPPNHGRTRMLSSTPVPYDVPSPPHMSRTPTTDSSSSRERQASPAGPRPLSQLPRKVHPDRRSIMILAPGQPPVGANSTLGERGIPRPAPPRRGHTYSHPPPSDPASSRSSQESSGVPARVRPVFRPHPPLETRAAKLARLSSGTPTPDTFPDNGSMPPSPFGSSSRNPTNSRLNDRVNEEGIDMDLEPDLQLSPLVPPYTENTALQRTMYQISHRVNVFLDEIERGHPQAESHYGPGSVSTKQPVEGPPKLSNASAHSVLHPALNPGINPRPRADLEDKENTMSEERQGPRVGSDSRRASTGIGLGVNRDVGKEMGNIVYLGEGLTMGKQIKVDKERKSKLLEPTSMAQKRSTLASPMSLTVPSSTTITPHRLLASPVIGEFKGWFSNLFNWKNPNSGQGGVLYSPDDVFKTRVDVGKLLENMGIIVEGIAFHCPENEFDGRPSSLRCRVDESNADTIAQGGMKALKFRVEFTSPSPPASPTPSGVQSRLPLTSLSSIPKPRSSVSSRMSNPNPNSSGLSKNRNSPTYGSAIMLVHERGSLSTFRIIWRQMKAIYSSDGSAISTCSTLSPATANVPFPETAHQHHRFSG